MERYLHDEEDNQQHWYHQQDERESERQLLRDVMFSVNKTIVFLPLMPWQGRPTLKLPHQLTKNPLADRKRRGKKDACQSVLQ